MRWCEGHRPVHHPRSTLWSWPRTAALESGRGLPEPEMVWASRLVAEVCVGGYNDAGFLAGAQAVLRDQEGRCGWSTESEDDRSAGQSLGPSVTSTGGSCTWGEVCRHPSSRAGAGRSASSPGPRGQGGEFEHQARIGWSGVGLQVSLLQRPVSPRCDPVAPTSCWLHAHGRFPPRPYFFVILNLLESSKRSQRSGLLRLMPGNRKGRLGSHLTGADRQAALTRNFPCSFPPPCLPWSPNQNSNYAWRRGAQPHPAEVHGDCGLSSLRGLNMSSDYTSLSSSTFFLSDGSMKLLGLEDNSWMEKDLL